MQELNDRVRAAIGAHRAPLLELSHSIAENPELGLEEHRAVAWVAKAVRQATGVSATIGVGGLPTALVAEAGTGSFVVTLCAEYDALPGIGHGCGHNVIAAAGVGAFIALSEVADALDMTVRLIGTPAEENVGGKIDLLEAGVFDGTHLAMMVHPGAIDEGCMRPYACSEVSAEFFGTEAHASMAPHLGRNALDALTVTLTALGLARQQLEPHQQFHGKIAGPETSANVIPGRASGTWILRGADVESLCRVRDVVERCIRAGALAANCETQITRSEYAYTHMHLDPELIEVYRGHAETVGREPSAVARLSGSTDMGNVSLRFPAIHPMIGLGDPELVLHTEAFAAAARGPAGDRAVLDGAVLLALTAIEAAGTEHLRARLTGPGPFGD